MDRKEFIDTLGTLLSAELPREQVEENIRYYDNYIRQQGDEDKQIEEIKRIGPPHLIAQTIIDSYKMSGQYKYTNQSSSDYGETYSTQPERDAQQDGHKEKSFLEKVKSVCITVTVIAGLVLLIRFAFVLFIRVGIPLIAIYFIIRWIKGAMDQN